jgi:hypothetical protein
MYFDDGRGSGYIRVRDLHLGSVPRVVFYYDDYLKSGLATIEQYCEHKLA